MIMRGFVEDTVEDCGLQLAWVYELISANWIIYIKDFEQSYSQCNISEFSVLFFKILY